MKPTDIPFVKHIGVTEENKELSLDCSDIVLNHIETIHAGAIYTLAETKSGMHMIELFPKLKGKVAAVLRESTIKYKKPATGKITAFASTESEMVETFKAQFTQKGRGILTIGVVVKDAENSIVAQAKFTWFVQNIH